MGGLVCTGLLVGGREGLCSRTIHMPRCLHAPTPTRPCAHVHTHQGDELDAKIRKAEKEVVALEATLVQVRQSEEAA